MENLATAYIDEHGLEKARVEQQRIYLLKEEGKPISDREGRMAWELVRAISELDREADRERLNKLIKNTDQETLDKAKLLKAKDNYEGVEKWRKIINHVVIDKNGDDMTDEEVFDYYVMITSLTEEYINKAIAQTN